MKMPLFILITCLLVWRGTAAQTTAQTLILSGDSWAYLATGQAPSTGNWTGSGSFNDTAWQRGISPLGYGNDGERTVVPYGPSVTNKQVHHYVFPPDNLARRRIRYV